MRIVVVAACPFPAPFGTQVLTQEFCESTAERGHEVHLVTYPVGAGEPFSPPYTIHRSLRLPGYRRMSPGPSAGKALLDLFLFWKLLGVVRGLRPHLIHAHNYEAAGISIVVGRLCKTPVVYHQHGLLSEELPFYSRAGLILRPLARAVDRYLIQNSTRTVCSSEEEREFVIQRVRPTKSPAVLPPSIRLDGFVERESTRIGAQPIVHYSGNLDSYQGILFLLGAFSRVIVQVPEAKLRIVTRSPVGTTESQAREKRIAQAVEFVKPRSFEAEVEMLLESSVCVCPRLTPSGFPMKVLNYMAASKPVVVTRAGARGWTHLEHVWVAEDGDEDSFAQGIIAFIKDRRLAEKVSRSSRKLVEAKHSRNSVVDRVESLYREVTRAGG